jgi:putative addiction module antidote
MVTLKVRKLGNSLGVVLPKEVINRLQTGEGQKLFLVEAPDGYQLSPYDPAVEEQLAAGREFMNEYRDTFKVLAE